MAETNHSSTATASSDDAGNSRTPINPKSQNAIKTAKPATYGTIEEPLLGDSRIGDVNDTTGADEIENPERPTGARFAVLFFCILLGDFFSGYVRPTHHNPPERVNLYIY